jgi:hypothetical protein
MIIENALFFKIAGKLGIQQLYLFFWRKHLVRNLLNFRRRVMLQRSKKSIFARSDYPLASRIAEDLKNFGIAKCDVSELQNAPSIGMLQKEYDVLLSQDDKNPHDRKSKSYIQRLVDDDYALSKHDSAISKYLLNETVALSCTLYLGLIPKLTSFKIWRSHQVEQSQREASQNWHRDYNEYQMVRVFLYFNDVSSNNGAGDYVLRSHFLGDGYYKLQDSNEGLSRYSTDSQVLTEFSSDSIITADGKAGTLYFVDTGGLHRGGYHPVPGERRVSLTTFSTAADLMPTRIRKPKNLKVKDGFFRRILV